MWATACQMSIHAQVREQGGWRVAVALGRGRECCVHARAVVTWRDHEQEWSPGRREHGRRGMPWQR